jgi:hypothetical protein
VSGPAVTTSPTVSTDAPLALLRHATMAALLAGVAPGVRRFEASGVVLEGGLLWVVCDNLAGIAAVDPALTPGSPPARLVPGAGPPAGYEDIAHDERAGRWFVLIESAPAPGGGYRPQIDEFDAAWGFVARRWVDLAVDRPNKGLEGVTCVHRDGETYLLALSEANAYAGGRHGRRPGAGVVHVLVERDGGWQVLDRIHLPSGLPFSDYSGLSLRGDRLAVASQESSALWVGRLHPDTWRVVDDGCVHPFPRDGRGRRRYGTVEGVCWLDDRTVAVVSDRTKRRRPRRLRATAESVHVFALPGPA